MNLVEIYLRAEDRGRSADPPPLVKPPGCRSLSLSRVSRIISRHFRARARARAFTRPESSVRGRRNPAVVERTRVIRRDYGIKLRRNISGSALLPEQKRASRRRSRLFRVDARNSTRRTDVLAGIVRFLLNYNMTRV